MKKETQEVIAKVEESVKEAIAYLDSCCDPAEPSMDYSYVDRQIGYLQDQLSRMWDALYRHTDTGHLPPILGAGQMQKALDSLGLDGDYQVQKKTIYASDTGKPVKVQWELAPK